MQLHVYLLVFIIATAGKASSALHNQCGSLHMDQETSGNITLTLPGALARPTPPQTESPPRDTACTWRIDVPSGQAVRLKLLWVDTASQVSVLCGRDLGEQRLEPGDGALLSGCDGDGAVLTWTAEGRSPHTLLLSYHAQEVGRNSSERPTSADQHRLSTAPPTSQTGPVFTSGSPAVPRRGWGGPEEEGSGADGVRGRPPPGRAWSSGPRSVSTASHTDQGLPPPPSPQPGLSAAGQADREAPPLPQEAPDNGADASGAPSVTAGRGLAGGEAPHTQSADARAHSHTQHTQSADAHAHSHTQHTQSADAHGEQTQSAHAHTQHTQSAHAHTQHTQSAHTQQTQSADAHTQQTQSADAHGQLHAQSADAHAHNQLHTQSADAHSHTQRTQSADAHGQLHTQSVHAHAQQTQSADAHSHTQQTQRSADAHSYTALVASTETNSGRPRAAQSPDAHTQTYLAVTDPAADISTGTDTHTDAERPAVGLADRRAATHAPRSTHARSPPISSAPSSATLLPPGDHAPGGERGHSHPPAWRPQRSTDRLRPRGLTPEVTPDPILTPSDANATDAENQTAGVSSSSSSSSSSQAPGRTSRSPTAQRGSELDASEGAEPAVSSSPDFTETAGLESDVTETSVSAESDVTDHTAGLESDVTDHTPALGSSDPLEGEEMLHTLPPPRSSSSPTPSPHPDSLTPSPPPPPSSSSSSTPRGHPDSFTPSPHALTPDTPTDDGASRTETRGAGGAYKATAEPRELPVSPAFASGEDGGVTGPRGSPPSATAPLAPGDVVKEWTATTASDPFLSSDVTAATTSDGGEEPLQATGRDTNGSLVFDPSTNASDSSTHAPLLVTSSTPAVLHGDNAVTPESTLQTRPPLPAHTTHDAPQRSTTTSTETPTRTPSADRETTSAQLPAQTHDRTLRTHAPLPTPSSATTPTHRPPPDRVTTPHDPLTTQAGPGGERESFVTTVAPPLPPQPPTTTTTARSLTARTTSMSPEPPPPPANPYPSQGSPPAGTSSASAPTLLQSSSTTRMPRFYIVPDQPATIQVESIELLLQILVEEPSVAFSTGLEEDTAAWVEPYLLRAPGFSRLQVAWSSGRAVQSLVEFRTRGALDWLGMAGPGSLLERTGLAQAVREGRGFRGSKVTNITLGGLQGAVCDWLLRCPAGYECVSRPGAANNHSCSSVCRTDHCHHHGLCTHHPGEMPICRCLAGEDTWYVGERCDVRMTRARLVGACLAVLIALVMLIGILALVAVRRYRTILIQAKVDQTRSSYRRFNHFDELSGRLRSWAGSADSLDNPAFTRSYEILHLRALDRACCYHDDTLSLASTCASHGTRINTVYPHSSQYGWRGSELSVGECVLDSGKASDLSVCSWPVEPIHWTPFPLLQRLASHSHQTPQVRASRTRSYCEGMELVDLGKSWTA